MHCQRLCRPGEGGPGEGTPQSDWEKVPLRACGEPLGGAVTGALQGGFSQLLQLLDSHFESRKSLKTHFGLESPAPNF